MDKVFVVTREGIYRHEICGIACTAADAKIMADTVAAADVDAYHKYVVYPFTLGEATPVVIDYTLFREDGFDLIEPDPIYAVNKNGVVTYFQDICDLPNSTYYPIQSAGS